MGISNPSGTPAATVVGPDTFGAAAAVGASSAYARADHDHGLPALSLTNASGTLGADVALTAATLTTVLTTASLAVGTWLLSASAEIVNGGATAGDAALILNLGTAVGTINGVRGSDGELPALAGGGVALACTTIISVTTAGTVIVDAYSSVAGTVKSLGTAAGGYVTGYTAVKIA